MTEIANVYGQALYDLAKDEGLAQEIYQQMTALNQGISAEPAFLQLLCTPSVPKAERCQVLDDSFRERVHPYLLNFLKILTEKGYMRHFSDCCQLFQEKYYRDNGILPVTAVTGVPMSDELREELSRKLTAATGKTVLLDCRVDPTCLGGIRLDLDGIRVDGTVRHRLDEIHAILKNTVL